MRQKQSAINLARELNKKHRVDYYVVYSPEEYDQIGNDYHVCKEQDVDTFYYGCKIVYIAEGTK